MRWSMDTHKYISEVTRKALQIMTEYGITSESEPEEILAVEKKLGECGVYKNYESAKGRVRRALFTYFKAYGCLDDNEHLTEVGRLYVENKLSIREFSCYYILNYIYEKDDIKYYPVQLILKCIRLIEKISPEEAYLTPYDFSKIVQCNNATDISREFVNDLLKVRCGRPISVNERTIGYDVWAKMLVQAGILTRDEDRNLVIQNNDLVDWILMAYEQFPSTTKGKIYTGVFKYIPIVTLEKSEGEISHFAKEGCSVQAYLFDSVDDYTNEKYIYSAIGKSYNDMKKALGFTEENRGFYHQFIGIERLIGYCLAQNEDVQVKNLGEIIDSVELSEMEMTELSENICIDHDFDKRLEGGCNVLLYGVPGSGKSWTIEHEYCKNSIVERLVFHPDYTYSDFIGQILPVVSSTGQVRYEFVAGPFTNILRAAYIHPRKEYVLVIEEINRGNASAIFGEVFQLLDRKIDNKERDDGYPIGTSEYGITNANIAKIVYGNPKHEVRIPSNLSIIGTMNTSDQNVFTLDTAFQRRWEMRLIENNFEYVDRKLADAYILDTGITWEVFCTEINKIIIGNNARMTSAEDKRLGAYFVHLKDLVFNPNMGNLLDGEYDDLRLKEQNKIITDTEKSRLEEIRVAMKQNRKFPEKVIKYLWDDAFKFNREIVFETTTYQSLEQVIRAFMYAEKLERFAMFKDNVRNAFVNPEE